jgi:hypothetical protein
LQGEISRRKSAGVVKAECPRLCHQSIAIRHGSVFPMAQLLFGQQSEGYDDQATARIGC